jgi:hypothetical protein
LLLGHGLWVKLGSPGSMSNAGCSQKVNSEVLRARRYTSTGNSTEARIPPCAFRSLL